MNATGVKNWIPNSTVLSNTTASKPAVRYTSSVLMKNTGCSHALHHPCTSVYKRHVEKLLCNRHASTLCNMDIEMGRLDGSWRKQFLRTRMSAIPGGTSSRRLIRSKNNLNYLAVWSCANPGDVDEGNMATCTTAHWYMCTWYYLGQNVRHPDGTGWYGHNTGCTGGRASTQLASDRL